MKLKEVLDKTTNFFKDKKFDSPRLDAELLLAHGLGLERIQLYLKFDQPLKDEELAACRELVRRRMTGEPVAYIVGYKDFYGYRFEVNSATLIPRPETEHLVEFSLEWVKGQAVEETKKIANEKLNQAYKIVDLGTGSGCVGLSLLKKLPQSSLVAVDISEAALDVAQRNAVKLEVQDRVRFIHGDAEEMANDIPSGIDILVANPPYIDRNDPHVEADVKKFEPDSALFSADNGLHFLKTWSDKYKNHLKPSSIMLMEMGFEQGPAMKKHFEALGIFQEVRIIKDLSGHDRIICGVKHG